MNAYTHERTRLSIPAHRAANEREDLRIRSLLELIPESGDSVLDIGARDGYLATLLTERYARVVALDLVPPLVADVRVEWAIGDVTAMTYDDATFDTVICAEVLEHVSPSSLERACREIVRVARRAIVIGVPYRQDLRCGETICRECGRINPPWGHQSRFDERRLRALFHGVHPSTIVHVGASRDVTNALSTRLIRLAGNPYGTYVQDEPCVHCGARLAPPRERTPVERIATRVATVLERAQRAVTPPRARWIHVRFDKAAVPHGQPAA